MREFTPLSVILGILIGVVMGAANAYVGLAYGLTISASIPAAVISMGILRGILRRGTILENNIVQTVGSAGESLAAGMIFTLPALFILDAEYPDAGMAPQGWWGYIQIATYAVLGGVLGVLMMIPLRRYLIVREHKTLPYPEGTACAEVLKSGQEGGSGILLVMGGLLLGAIHQFFGGLIHLWENTIRIPLTTRWIDMRSNVAMETAASLLGVGFILGLRISAIMVGGGILAWLVIIPLIAYFGQYITEPLKPATEPLFALDARGIYDNYIRYIGAGGVVFGGVISLLKAFPTITSSVWHAVVELFRGKPASRERTDEDLPIWIVIGGTLLIIAAVWLTNLKGGVGLPMAIAVAVCGFIFVAVAARIVGLVGSTSSPVSGMTIATVLGAGLIFVAMGKSGPGAMAALIGVASIVCIAIAIAGDGAQDLKTGFLVGATPAKQQIGEIVGVVTSAITCAGILLLLNQQNGFIPHTTEEIAAAEAAGTTLPVVLQAPQANIIALLLKGIFDVGLPWELILIGIASALVIECVGIPALPFAVGLYLPLEVTSPIFAGGLLHWLLVGRKPVKRGEHGGILISSGLVAGSALMGLLGAALAAMRVLEAAWWDTFVKSITEANWVSAVTTWGQQVEHPWHGWTVSFVPFAFLILIIALVVWLTGRRDNGGPTVATVVPDPPAPKPPAPQSPDPKPPSPGFELRSNPAHEQRLFSGPTFTQPAQSDDTERPRPFGVESSYEFQPHDEKSDTTLASNEEPAPPTEVPPNSHSDHAADEFPNENDEKRFF